MKFSELLSRLMSWRKSNDANPIPLDEAERHYSNVCERELKKQKGVLQRRSDFLESEVQRLQLESESVRKELNSMEKTQVVSLQVIPKALPSPPNLDQSDQQVAIREAKKKMADLLGELSNSRAKEQSVKKMYNPALLDQESDELLHYL